MSYLEAPALAPLRRGAVRTYVTEIRRLLYLQHWRIEMPAEYPENGDDAIVEVHPTAGRYYAMLRFGPEFWSLDQEDTRNAIVHELLHLHHVRVTDAVRIDEYRQELGQSLYNQLNGAVKREAEYMVDALATVIAEYLPLPEPWPWPDGEITEANAFTAAGKAGAIPAAERSAV